MNLKKVVFLLVLVFNFISCDKNEIITPSPLDIFMPVCIFVDTSVLG
jgi:hypothetical protein